MFIATLWMLLIVNVLASIFIIRRDDLVRFQVITQVVIVWVIPFIGAIAIWLFHKNNDEPIEADVRSGNSGEIDSYTVGGPGGSDHHT
jgi:hypothetical protein